MSKFEDYSHSSKEYDRTRVSVGLDVVVDVCSALPRSIAVLDAGCGTANYLADLRERLGERLGRIAGIDLNEGMLSRARTKLGGDPRAEFVRGPLDDLPFDDQGFDLVLNTQVLHHLDGGDPPGSFPIVRAFVQEVRRVLKPGGVFAINTSSHEQLVDGFWWAALIPDAIGILRGRLPDLSVVQQALRDAGFTSIRTVAPDGVLQGAAYFDPAGPLDPAWRQGDSTWSLASPQELDAALDRVRRLIADDEMEGWFAGREARRAAVGQTTFVLAS